MKCDICADSNVGPDHEITEKHMKNKVLYEYSLNRKQFAGNRKGVVVTCNVKNLLSCSDAKIKISAKPKELVKFQFVIQNESKKEDIIVIFIQMAHSILKNFTISNHGLQFGCEPVTLKPKGILQKEVSVSFTADEVGQYQVPIILSFRKPATGEGIVIMRDMVVFVEEKPTTHEKIISPYRQMDVISDKLFKTTHFDLQDLYRRSRSDDMFRIPKNYKKIFASRLDIKEDAPEEDKAICKQIREIFETGVTEDNYMRYFHNLLWYEETIVRINLKKYNMSGVPLLPQGIDKYILIVPGLGEKRPSLMTGDLIFVKPHHDNDVMFEAVISEIGGENTVTIKGLHHEFSQYASFNMRYDIRFFMCRMPLERMHQAVNCVTRGGPEQNRVFPIENKNVNKSFVKPIDKYFNPLLVGNPEQRAVVEHIVSGSAGTAPYLVHGPPGTGKTVTIVEAILQIVAKNPKSRVMVCTDSNMAADHVATVIIKYASLLNQQNLLLRASSKFRVWESLPECLRPFSNGYDREHFIPVSVEDFLKYRIVITTLSHAAKYAKDFKKKRMERPITHLFIDEAAQASEPACLIPICGLLSPRGSLVLAGDPLQLGPVVISHHARKLGLGLSLMERLRDTCSLYSEHRDDPNYTLMLRNNFRSDPEILHLPNEIFYRGQLRPQAKHDALSKVCILGERAESSAVVFHGVLSKEQRMGKSPSFFNNIELEVVQRYIRQLVTKHEVEPQDIGVVTPYTRQASKIKAWLQSSFLNGERIEVGTVEAFQGKEKRVIIISTVRANCGLLDHDAKFQLGFLVDDKRFNVALTRAKAKAIIIGNPLCLQKDIKWRTYMNKCRDLGTYHGYDSESYKPEVLNKDIMNRLAPLLNDLKLSQTDKKTKQRPRV